MVIEVTVEPDSESESKLKVSPQDIELNDGDWVRWSFTMPLGDDQFGFIFFSPRLGPFHSLRSSGNSGFLGKGNIGPAANPSYGYTAMLLQVGGKDPIATGEGTITNKATKPDTSPDVFVTYNSDPSLTPPEALTVSSETVGLNFGDTATWCVSELPDGAFVNFRFTVDGVPASQMPANGPFVNFYAVGDGPTTVRASGTGFAMVPLGGSQAWPAKITYYLEVRDQNGVLLGSHEPVIDNLGVPPTGPES